MGRVTNKISIKRPKSKQKGPISTPKVTSGLSAAARKEWGRIIAALAQMELLELTDEQILAAYITSFDRWKQAEGKLKRAGIVIREVLRDRHQNIVGSRDVPSPWVKIARDNEATCLRLLRRMNLDTASRLKAQPKPPTKSEEEAARDAVWDELWREGEEMAAERERRRAALLAKDQR